MEELPRLDGRRVLLRGLRPADAAAIYAVFGDPRVTRSMGIETRRDEAHARAFIDDVQRLARADTLYQWGIAVRDDDRLIGTVTLASLDPRNRRAELGFAVGSDHQRRGYATEAVRLIVRHAFDTMGLHRLEADVDPDNRASIALLERLGFAKEGYMPERWLMDGQWQDTVFYGLLAGS